MDENKTALTHRVTALAAAYLDAGGFKPVEAEVQCHDGWVADLAGFVYPTMTECKKMKLLPKYGGSTDKLHRELEYYYQFPLTAICEVKTSRADFRKDLNTKFYGQIYPAHLCYLAYPAGIVAEDEIPVGWIGLETTQQAGKIKKVTTNKKCFIFQCLHAQRPGDVTDLIANIAIRRDHRTRYAVNKAFLKAIRARGRERKRENIAAGVINDIAEWLKDNKYRAVSDLKTLIERRRDVNLSFRADSAFNILENTKKSLRGD